MQPDNFEKVKELMGRYIHINEKIEELRQSVHIKIFNDDRHGKPVIMTIGATSDCEHPAKLLAIGFIKNLIQFYVDRLHELKKEIEAL